MCEMQVQHPPHPPTAVKMLCHTIIEWGRKEAADGTTRDPQPAFRPLILALSESADGASADVSAHIATGDGGGGAFEVIELPVDRHATPSYSERLVCEKWS